MFHLTYYPNYLKFFERARTEWLRSLGHHQQALADATGTIFIVTNSRVRYLSPARLDDELNVTVQPTEVGRARMVIAQQAWRSDTLLCDGEITIEEVTKYT